MFSMYTASLTSALTSAVMESHEIVLYQKKVSVILTLKGRRFFVFTYSLDVAPLTGKIIKNHLRVFERGGNLLQNGMLHFIF